MTLPEIGPEGQVAISQASAAIIGCGGLGHPAALILAGAGVGNLLLADGDKVSLNNLHRQFAFHESDLGKNKANALAEKLKALNHDIAVSAFTDRIDRENALDVLSGYEIVLDCTDDIQTRYLLSDACVLTGKVLVSASIHRNEGQLSVFNHNNGPTYRCFFPEATDNAEGQGCEHTGVSAVTTSVLGSMQAGECLKVILGNKDALYGKMLLLNCRNYAVEFISAERSSDAYDLAGKSFGVVGKSEIG